MINKLKCRKCHKNFTDCKCPDKYLRYTHLKKIKKRKIKTWAIIGIILLVCFLVFAVIWTVEAMNTPNQNHPKAVYYNPNLNDNQKTHSQPCPCSG